MPALIAWAIAGLSSLFASRIGQWLVSALVFLGLELAVTSFAVEPVLAQISAVSTGVVGDAAGWLAFFNIDKYITLILSAYAVSATKAAFLRKRGV